MELIINGQSQELDETISLRRLVLDLYPHAEQGGVAVAVKGEIVPKSKWQDFDLQDGQDIELVSATAGG